jgi:hypothetical protein
MTINRSLWGILLIHTARLAAACFLFENEKSASRATASAGHSRFPFLFVPALFADTFIRIDGLCMGIYAELVHILSELREGGQQPPATMALRL